VDAAAPVPAPLAALEAALAGATGADAAVDRAVAAAFGPGEAAADWSASVERCTALVARVLPGWRWHVGWGVSGLFPYARLEQGAERVSAEAPTVPIALLRALVKAASGRRDPRPEPTPRAVWQRPDP
jgi:hypothetical protein